MKIQDFDRFEHSPNYYYCSKTKVFYIIIIILYLRFNGEFVSLYYWKFFLQPGLLVYAVSVSIFLYLKVSSCIHQLKVLHFTHLIDTKQLQRDKELQIDKEPIFIQ